MKEKETIAAISTPQGIGALSVIRVSGNKTFLIIKKAVSEADKFKRQKERTIANYEIKDKKNKTIDEVIIIKYKNPKSYTGEDLVEVICHGGSYIKEKILEIIIENGARMAKRGEYTKRALLNGKIDLLKAEAIKAIIESTNEDENNIAISYYKKENQKNLILLKDQIKTELSYIEAQIEFEEEEQNNLENERKCCIEEIIKRLEEEIEIKNKVTNESNGTNVTLIGLTNVGKSSLYNKIIGHERSIVTKTAGTTRDCVKDVIYINKKKISIHDTAGLRKTKNMIEKEGQKKSREIIDESQIIIWVTDSSKKITEEEKTEFNKILTKETIVLINKIDINKNKEKHLYYKEKAKKTIETSAKENININTILETIEKEIKEEKNIKTTFILNNRHMNLIEKVKDNLKQAKKSWAQKEIAAYYLNKALDEIEEITGKGNKEEVMEEIFNTFCIGK